MSLSSNTAHPVISFAPINNRDMRLIDFMEAFPDEASCKSKLKEYREKQGVVCPRCGSTQHYWKKDKECYECKHCHYRLSLKSNTVMHGSQKKSKVLVMAQTEEGTPSKKSDKPTSVKYIKMFVIEDLKSETIDEKVKMHIDPDSTIKSDNSKSYTNFSTIVKEHIHQVIEPKQVGKVLPWVHIAIANAKRLLLDVYHDIRPEYLQNYPNEFCWKFNRRNFGEALFDRLMVAAVSYKNQFRYNIE